MKIELADKLFGVTMYEGQYGSYIVPDAIIASAYRGFQGTRLKDLRKHVEQSIECWGGWHEATILAEAKRVQNIQEMSAH